MKWSILGFKILKEIQNCFPTKKSQNIINKRAFVVYFQSNPPLSPLLCFVSNIHPPFDLSQNKNMISIWGSGFDCTPHPPTPNKCPRPDDICFIFIFKFVGFFDEIKMEQREKGGGRERLRKREFICRREREKERFPLNLAWRQHMCKQEPKFHLFHFLNSFIGLFAHFYYLP